MFEELLGGVLYPLQYLWHDDGFKGGSFSLLSAGYASQEQYQTETQERV